MASTRMDGDEDTRTLLDAATLDGDDGDRGRLGARPPCRVRQASRVVLVGVALCAAGLCLALLAASGGGLRSVARSPTLAAGLLGKSEAPEPPTYGCFGSNDYDDTTCSGEGEQTFACEVDDHASVYSDKGASVVLAAPLPPGSSFIVEWDMQVMKFSKNEDHYATLMELPGPGGIRFKALQWSSSACNDQRMHHYRLDATQEGYTVTCDGSRVEGWTGTDWKPKRYTMQRTPFTLVLGAHISDESTLYCRQQATFSRLTIRERVEADPQTYGCFGSSTYADTTCSGEGDQVLAGGIDDNSGKFKDKGATVLLRRPLPPGSSFTVEWDMQVMKFTKNEDHYATLMELTGPGGIRFKAFQWSSSACNDRKMHHYHLEATQDGYTVTCDGSRVEGWTGTSWKASEYTMPTTPFQIVLGAHVSDSTLYCRIMGIFSRLTIRAAAPAEEES